MEEEIIYILYGSQTGTAEFVAEELEREFNKHCFFNIKVSALDDFDFLLFPGIEYCIFIVSTTGYGETPSNMKKFWNFIMRKDLPNDSLESLNYSLFGLGDSSYEKFNYIGKLLDLRLRKGLSANLIHPIGLGDDQHDFGWEGEFDPWAESLINKFKHIFQISPIISLSKQEFKIKQNLKVSIIKDEENSNFKELLSENDDKDVMSKQMLSEKHEIYSSKILNYSLLTSPEYTEKKVFNLELEIHSNQKDYKVGDVAQIFPQNPNKMVQEFLNLLNLKPEWVLKIEKHSSNITGSKNLELIPEYITCQNIFQCYLNIAGIPNRYFCEICSHFTEDEIHKEKLNLFSSKSKVIIFLN
jgi:sulfite reductase alpha subunit-like flavoprotein